MNNQVFVITGVSRLHTANMQAKGMTPRYQFDVQGDFPRTDKVGAQCTISIPEATLAIHLEKKLILPSGNTLDENIILLQEEPMYLQKFINGTVGGVIFQKKGDTYKLTEFSRDVQDGNAKVGDERTVEENRFSLIYNSLDMQPNQATVEMHLEVKMRAEIYERAQRKNVFGNVFAQPAQPSITAETTDEPQEDAWKNDLAATVKYAEENEIDISKLVKQNGELKAGKTHEELITVVSTLV